MKNRFIFCLHALLAFSIVLAPVSAGVAADPADTIYLGGTIYTMTESYDEAMDDGKARKVEAVATKDGKVVFTGSRADAEAQYMGGQTKIVDLQGKTMLPGFVDAHGHFPGSGTSDLYEVDLNSPPLGPMTSIEDYIAALSAQAAITPVGDWIIGWGYDDTLISEMRHPTAADLDRVSTDHPIYISHISKHMAVANTKAMDVSDIKNHANYNDEVAAGNVPVVGGEPTGFLRETKAMAMISTQAKTAAQNLRGVHRGAETYLAAGVTTADDGASFMAAGQSLLPRFQKLAPEGKLPLRVVMHPLARYNEPDVAGYVRDYLGWTGSDTIDGVTFPNANPAPDSPRAGEDISDYKNTSGTTMPEGRIWMGSWKLIFDGSNQGYTGWFKYPGYYIHPDGETADYHAFTALNFTPQNMAATVKFLHSRDHSVEVHGNGNAAVEAIVTAIEEAVAANPSITDKRHTIIHSQMAERQHVERMMGIYDNLTPALANMYGYPDTFQGLADDVYMLTGTYANGAKNGTLIAGLNNGQLMRDQNLVNSYYVAHTYYWGDRHRDIFMGPGRAKNMSPAGWSIYNRNIFNFHSDTPVVPMSPLRNLQAGVTRVSSNGNDIFHTGKDYHGTINLPETQGGPLKSFWDYDQRVNRLMGLKAVTVNAAYPNFLEDKIGVIKTGAYADFVVLGKDPLTAPALQLADLRIVATIVSDSLEYGYLPGAANFAGKVVGSYLQVDDNSETLVSAQNAYTKDEALNKGYTLPDASELYTVMDFEGTLSGGADSAVFHFLTFGNDQPSSSFSLASLDGNGEYTYGRPDPFAFATSDGVWWFAPISAPNSVLGPDDVLKNNEAYIAYLVLADNGAFDTDSGVGDIAGNFALTATALPQDKDDEASPKRGGGSSGGCSMGGNAFGLELLLALGALAVLVLRRRVTINR